jgi:tRNA-dihydrouridine synthase A
MIPLSVAPMMDHTDRHCRTFLRLLSRRVLLYTEMIPVGAILRGQRDRILAYDPAEHPVALQIGGDDPTALAECARIAEDLGYDEVNLNVGCPSDRVQSGSFGACLMRRPELVAEGVAAMRAVVGIPVTVKHRIGVDELDAYEDMAHFVATVAAAGCDGFIVHARKAWLKGLSPKQNRQVPPLRYHDVYRLKRDFPGLSIAINGGILSLEDARDHLQLVDSVMMGRAVMVDPYLLARADRHFFRDAAAETPSRAEVVLRLIPYIEAQLAAGERLDRLIHPLLDLYHGRPGAGIWRRRLSEEGRVKGAGSAVLLDALGEVEGTRAAA